MKLNMMKFSTCATLVLFAGSLSMEIGAQVGDSLHPERGVALIWYGGQDNLDSRGGVVTVGQIFFMWRWFEPNRDEYDLESLDQQMKTIHDKGMKATLQINGNRHPDYLFQIVPYLDGVALPTQYNHTAEIGYGPPMYWHPTYKDRYRKMIDTVASHIKNSPYKDAILGIRQSYNAVGTEHHYIPPEYRDRSAWTFEEGVTEEGEFPWTTGIADAYRTWAIDMYIDAFNPPADIPVFMRAGAIAGGYATASHLQMVENGDLWIFHTSSEPQPRSGKIGQYQAFVDYAKTGKTYAFMESWSAAKTTPGDDSWIKTGKPITVEQFNYWTLLVDLHCGATWPAMRPEDVDHPTFREHYEFAARYAGYIASPRKTPGAWVAFREGDNLVGDYTFLMERAAGDNSLPLYNVDDSPQGLWARQVASGGAMELVLEDEYALSIRNSRNASLSVTYKDVGTDEFTVEAFGHTFTQARTGTGEWLAFTTSVDVEEVTNIRIHAGDSDLTLHMVELERGEPDRSGDIVAPTAPSNLTVADTGRYSCSLSWDPASDAVGVTGYLIYRNAELLTTVTGTGTTLLGLDCETSYSFYVKARDAPGNLSESSNKINVKTLGCPESPALYTEDFDDNLAQGWQADPPDKWSVAQGAYRTVKGGVYRSVYSGQNFKDYTFSVDADPSFGNDFGLIFNYLDEQNYYRLELDASPLTAALAKIENGSRTTLATGSYSEGGQYVNNQIDLENGSSEIRVFVNGQRIFSHTGISPPADSGKIGLYVSYNPVEFDNVEVYKSTPADTMAPSVPAGITATNVTETSLDLIWNAAADTSGIAGYRVYKNGLLEKTVPDTSAAITGLRCDSSYSFFVSAVDARGNVSGPGEPVSVSTAACSDVTPPGVPADLAVISFDTHSARLSWTASTDNVAVTSYHVYIDGLFETAVFSGPATIYGLECATSYLVSIRAKDASGNLSGEATAEVTTAVCPDEEPPTSPTGLILSQVTGTSFDLSWDPSSDNTGISGYNVYLNDAFRVAVEDTSASITGVTCGTDYQVTVAAFDTSGNLSAPSEALTVTTIACPDTEPPTAPSDLAASDITHTSVRLSWTASTDDSGVSEYSVYIGEKLDTTVTLTRVEIPGLTCDTTYLFTVKAMDHAGNISDASNPLAVSTLGCNAAAAGNLSRPVTVSVYPVPFTDALNIRLQGFHGRCRVKIYNVLGGCVASEKVDVAGEHVVKTGQNLPDGFYLVRVESGDLAVNRHIIKR